MRYGQLMRFFFDFHGTLVGNPDFAGPLSQLLLVALMQHGAEVVVWSGDPGAIPDAWQSFCHDHNIPVMDKDVATTDLVGAVVVDDDLALLRAALRQQAIVVPASALPVLWQLISLA